MSRFQPPTLQGKFAYDCYELCRGWCVRLSVWSCVHKEYPNRAKNHVSKVDPYNPPTFYAAILRSEHFGIARSLLHLLDAHPSKCCVKTTVARGGLNSVLSFNLHFQGQRGSTTCLANFTQWMKVLAKITMSETGGHPKWWFLNRGVLKGSTRCHASCSRVCLSILMLAYPELGKRSLLQN
jgi:hypothetical protein